MHHDLNTTDPTVRATPETFAADLKVCAEAVGVGFVLSSGDDCVPDVVAWLDNHVYGVTPVDYYRVVATLRGPRHAPVCGYRLTRYDADGDEVECLLFPTLPDLFGYLAGVYMTNRLRAATGYLD